MIRVAPSKPKSARNKVCIDDDFKKKKKKKFGF